MARFRLRDLLVTTLIIAIAMAILLPMIQTAREASRRQSCSNNVKQIGLAIHNYHAAYQQLPPAMGGTVANEYRLSGLVTMVPFLLASPMWDQISNPLSVGGRVFPPMGPVPTNRNYPPWTDQLELLLCPSDAGPPSVRPAGFGKTNYTFCIGDVVRGIHAAKQPNQARGMFSPRVVLRFGDIIDGTSNTVMAGEIGTASGRRIQGQFVVDTEATILDRPIDVLQRVDPNSPANYSATEKLSKLGRGGSWADGAAGHALFNTILPPNSPSAGTSVTPTDGVFSAGSFHVGGCHLLMGDGSVRFISDTIDSGDLTVPPPATLLDPQNNAQESPYGVWGALGTRGGGEIDLGSDRPADQN